GRGGGRARGACSRRQLRFAFPRRRHPAGRDRIETVGMSATATFRAGLVAMRSGVSPAANLDAAVALIKEAAGAGADYVQTPEMTNLMDVRRERLLETVVAEEKDPSLARFRELARQLGIYVHIGSLAVKVSPERAGNRSFLIDREGEIVGRYTKIHMFDVDLANGESYRESRTFRPGES